MALGSKDILAVLFKAMNMGYLSISLYHLQFPCSTSYRSQIIGLSPPCLGLYLGILFFYGVIINGGLFSFFLFPIVHY